MSSNHCLRFVSDTHRRLALAFSAFMILVIVLAGCGSTQAAERTEGSTSRLSRGSSDGHEATSRASSSRTSRTTASAGHSAASTTHEAADAGHGATETTHAKVDTGHQEAPHWAYEGKLGPGYWGDLADEFIACKSGTSQSHINVQSSSAIDSTESVFTNYGDTLVTILNNGNTIQLNYDAGSVAYLDGQEYELLQFHFHTPSENHVDGSAFPMEMHLVHKNAEGGLGVIGVLFEAGEENPLFAKFWDFLPREEGEVPSDLRIDITDVLPGEPHYYAFDGSLTAPPCSEGVKWFLMEDAVQASRGQMDKFTSIFGANARPIQPLNGRVIGGF